MAQVIRPQVPVVVFTLHSYPRIFLRNLKIYENEERGTGTFTIVMNL